MRKMFYHSKKTRSYLPTNNYREKIEKITQSQQKSGLLIQRHSALKARERKRERKKHEIHICILQNLISYLILSTFANPISIAKLRHI